MVDARLRVLVLGDSRSFHIERYMAELTRQGVIAELVSVEEGDIAYTPILCPRFPFGLFYLAAAQRLKTIMRRFKPDVINPHFVSGYGFLAAVAKARRFAPVLLHCWGSDILIVPEKSTVHRWKTRKALRESDFVTGDSEYILRAAEALAPLPPKEPIPWGIECKYLDLHRERYQLGKPLRVIVPRHHEPVYNNQFLLNALEPLIVDGKLHLTFPSWGSLAGRFHSLAAKHGDSVQLYDTMPRDAFLAFMAQHDVYLSGAWSDSSPVSLIEAMALGLIPIAPDIEGNREWLTADSGYAYPLDVAARLRSIVESIIDTNDEHRRMRESNLARVKETAVFEDNIARIIDIMHGLVRERRQ